MRSPAANADSRLSLWQHVRAYAVPPSMIETATARREAGDWAGACAAARIDVDLDLRTVARRHGREVVTQLRADLRHLAPDLLRWHMPRIAPDGLLRPGLTLSLARYGPVPDDGTAPQLVVRTPPAWANAGQRMSLALWCGGREDPQPRHPHPRPDPRFRFDLHPHLWDARRSGDLRHRSGADSLVAEPGFLPWPDPLWSRLRDGGYAVHRWAAEAACLLAAEGRPAGPVGVRLGSRRRLLLHLAEPRADGTPLEVRMLAAGEAKRAATLPVLPEVATWICPDLELLRRRLVGPDELHPLVASALAPGGPQAAPAAADPAGQPYLVECRGALHRIGIVRGTLTPLDHDPAQLRREELLAELTGTPLPCVQAIDQAHRNPESLPDVRARLAHGDTAGALAVIEALLGPDALLRSGDLRQALEQAARRRISYGLFRSGLTVKVPPQAPRVVAERQARRARPRLATRL